MYQLGSKVSLRFVSFQHILTQWQKKKPWGCICIFVQHFQAMTRAIFLREGLFFETLALTTGKTESGWVFVALKSLSMPS